MSGKSEGCSIVGWREGGFKPREETRAQAAQAKRGLLERMRRSSQPEPPPAPTKFAHIPRDEIESAGDRLRFRLLNDADGDAKVGSPVPLNRSSRILLSGFFDALPGKSLAFNGPGCHRKEANRA